MRATKLPLDAGADVDSEDSIASDVTRETVVMVCVINCVLKLCDSSIFVCFQVSVNASTSIILSQNSLHHNCDQLNYYIILYNLLIFLIATPIFAGNNVFWINSYWKPRACSIHTCVSGWCKSHTLSEKCEVLVFISSHRVRNYMMWYSRLCDRRVETRGFAYKCATIIIIWQSLSFLGATHTSQLCEALQEIRSDPCRWCIQ